MPNAIVEGDGGRLCLTLHYHHQNDSCITTGSDESIFSVRQCPLTTTFEERFYLAARYLTARPVRFQTKWSEKSGAGPR